MQDKIITTIAAYLEKETNPIDTGDKMWVEFGGLINRPHFTHSGFCQEIATEIAAAIAPLVEAGEPDWKPKIDDEILIDGKRQAVYRGSDAGLAIVLFKSGMQLTVPFDRISKL